MNSSNPCNRQRADSLKASPAGQRVIYSRAAPGSLGRRHWGQVEENDGEGGLERTTGAKIPRPILVAASASEWSAIRSLALKAGIALEDFRLSRPGCEHVEYALDPDAHAPDASKEHYLKTQRAYFLVSAKN